MQAMQVSIPGSQSRIDCDAVRLGCWKSLHKLTLASQKLARVCFPIALYLEDASSGSVVWMPAHIEEHQVGTALLSNGQLLSVEDCSCNAEADRLAKLAAEEDR